MKKLNAARNAALLAASALLFSCAAKKTDVVLSIVWQGVFSSGGTVTQPVPGEYNAAENWLDKTRAGNTAHIDHANVFFQIPSEEKANPVVFLHGYGQSRTGWQSTPDGREGWADLFLKNRRSVFLVD